MLEVRSLVTCRRWGRELEGIVVLGTRLPGTIKECNGINSRGPRFPVTWINDQRLLEILFQHHLALPIKEAGTILQGNRQLVAVQRFVRRDEEIAINRRARLMRVPVDGQFDFQWRFHGRGKGKTPGPTPGPGSGSEE